MAVRLRIVRTFIYASEVPSECLQPRSRSLPPGAGEFGPATADASVGSTVPPLECDKAVTCLPQQPELKRDASVGTTVPPLERDKAVTCLPQQPEQKKRRPCKAQRDRIKKQLATIEFGPSTTDTSVGTTDETVTCLPQQPEQKKKRPCKAQRDRIKRQLVVIERQIEVNPHDVDLSAMFLRAEWTQRRIRSFFQSKLEERAEGQSNAIQL